MFNQQQLIQFPKFINCDGYNGELIDWIGRMQKQENTPYVVDNVAFLIKSDKHPSVYMSHGCRTCARFVSEFRGYYGPNHESVLFPEGIEQSLEIPQEIKDLVAMTHLRENSVTYDIKVLNTHDIGIKQLGKGIDSVTGRYGPFYHFSSKIPTSIKFNKANTQYCEYLVKNYGHVVEDKLTKKTMKIIENFLSIQNDIAYACFKFHNAIKGFSQLYDCCLNVSENDKKINIIKFILSNDDGIFHILSNYSLMKELIGIFSDCETDDGYDLDQIKNVLITRLNPLIRGHKSTPPSEGQIKNLERTFGNVTVSTVNAWEIQNYFDAKLLQNEHCPITQIKTLMDVLTYTPKLSIRIGSIGSYGAIVKYDMAPELQSPEENKWLFTMDMEDGWTYKTETGNTKINCNDFYEVSGIIPLDGSMESATSYLFVIPKLRPPNNSNGWYDSSYLHNSIKTIYARAFEDIKNPLIILKDDMLVGVGVSIKNNLNELLNYPHILINGEKTILTHK